VKIANYILLAGNSFDNRENLLNRWLFLGKVGDFSDFFNFFRLYFTICYAYI